MKLSDITQDYLKQKFTYDGENLVWKDTRFTSKIGKKAGTIKAEGYRQIAIDKVSALEHRLVFMYVHGYMPKEIDHINGNRSDNHIENLRDCSKAENLRNTKIPRTNKTGVKGVFWDNTANKWHGRVWANGKFAFSKCYEKFEDAVQAVREARQLHHGVYANHG
jgi:hypothetical protein